MKFIGINEPIATNYNGTKEPTTTNNNGKPRINCDMFRFGFAQSRFK